METGWQPCFQLGPMPEVCSLKGRALSCAVVKAEKTGSFGGLNTTSKRTAQLARWPAPKVAQSAPIRAGASLRRICAKQPTILLSISRPQGICRQLCACRDSQACSHRADKISEASLAGEALSRLSAADNQNDAHRTFPAARDEADSPQCARTGQVADYGEDAVPNTSGALTASSPGVSAEAGYSGLSIRRLRARRHSKTLADSTSD